MVTTNIENERRVYVIPAIEKIILDNDISLVLATEPPFGPGEVKNDKAPEYFNKDPYGNNA